MAILQKRISGFHLVYANDYSQEPRLVPIWIYEINDVDIFQVKFEYKAQGYKGLRFSDRRNRIEIIHSNI